MSEEQNYNEIWRKAEEKLKLIEIGSIFLAYKLVQDTDVQIVINFLKTKQFDDSMINQAL